MRTTHALALVSLTALLHACGSPPPGAAHDPHPPERTERDQPSVVAVTCEGNERIASIHAYADGVAFAAVSDEGLTVQRARGVGCELVPAGEPVAVGALLDVDDAGALYAHPTSPRCGTVLDNVVVKVDTDGSSTELVAAGRGIWGFGIAPSGGALWMTSCGPTGIFAITPDGLAPALESPRTLWQQVPSVLSDDVTFFSVGVRTCDWSAPLSDDCGLALVRTTPDGDVEVNGTVRDFGAGFEQANLARCGAHVCGVFASAVVVWDRDGAEVLTLDRAALAATPAEDVRAASGNAHGVYVLLWGGEADRVVFAPWQRAVTPRTAPGT